MSSGNSIARLKAAATANARVVRRQLRFWFECWLAKYSRASFVDRIGRRIQALETDPRTAARDYFELGQAYEVVARYYEHRGRFDSARLVTLTHGSHPMLPPAAREEVYVFAGLRALRRQRLKEAAEYLELARQANAHAGGTPFYPVLEQRLLEADGQP